MIVELPIEIPDLPQVTHVRVASVAQLMPSATEEGTIRLEIEGGALEDSEDVTSYRPLPALRVHRYRLAGEEYIEATKEVQEEGRCGRILDLDAALAVAWKHVRAEYGIDAEEAPEPDPEA